VIARDPSSHADMGADTLFDQQGSLSPNQRKYLTLAPGAEDQRNYNTRIVDNFSSLDNTLPKLAWDLMLYRDVANPEAINISEQTPSRTSGIGPKRHHQSDPSSGQILLIRNVLIDSNQNIKAAASELPGGVHSSAPPD
jgi:hypothetical protein